MNHSTYLG